MPTIPLLKEYVTDYFESAPQRRLHRTFFAFLASAVLISWPSNPVSYYLQFNSKPITFFLGFMVMFLFGYLISVIPEFRDRRGQNTLSDWVFYTPINVAAAYGGFFAFSLLHVSYPVLTAAPLLIVGAIASGVTARVVALSALLVFLYSLFSKLLIVLLHLTMGKRPFPRILLFGAFVLFSILLSVRLYPTANPVLATQTLITGETPVNNLGEPIYPSWQATSIFYSIGIALLSAAALLRLSLVRREAKKRQ